MLIHEVTIYARGEFIGNFHKIEATAYKVELVAHAQYADAVRFVYKGKGKRILRGSVQSYQPSLVVLEGWGHVEPPSMWNKGELMGNGVTVQHATHMAYDEGWSRDFGVVLDDHAPSVKIFSDSSSSLVGTRRYLDHEHCNRSLHRHRPPPPHR